MAPPRILKRFAMPTNEPHDAEVHWENVYRTKASDSVSWHREHLETSLALLEQAGLSSDSRIIDVGGGASTLVDDLLARGVNQVTVLDLSWAALDIASARLGPRARTVQWMAGDVTSLALPDGEYSHWHDRTVLHFLTRQDQVAAYVHQATHALMVGGHAVIGGFAPDGPVRCSGLDVARRSAQDIARLSGRGFKLLDCRRELHRTPDGNEQAFEYALLQRTG